MGIISNLNDDLNDNWDRKFCVKNLYDSQFKKKKKKKEEDFLKKKSLEVKHKNRKISSSAWTTEDKPKKEKSSVKNGRLGRLLVIQRI